MYTDTQTDILEYSIVAVDKPRLILWEIHIRFELFTDILDKVGGIVLKVSLCVIHKNPYRISKHCL